MGRRGSARAARAGLDGAVRWSRAARSRSTTCSCIVVGPVVLVALTLLMRRTRFGVLVRAASENRVLAAALGIDEAKLFTAVFALGAFLAGLAGALQLPREPANLGMDLAMIADAFVVTVVGGLGSIPGAFVAAIIIGVTKALCIAAGNVDRSPASTIALPKLTLVVEFIVMAVVLLVDPQGLFGTPPTLPATTAAAGRARADRAGRRGVMRSPPSHSSRSPCCCRWPATSTRSCSRPTS